MTKSGFRPSSFLATKGAMVEPTYRAFRDWDLAASQADNMQRIRETNSIGAPSAGWLKDFSKIISRRFDTERRDRPLVELAANGWSLDDWRPLLLWHICQSDPLLTSFIGEWLFGLREQGIVQVRSEAAKTFLRDYLKKHRPRGQQPWSEANLTSSANGLLRTTVEFHLMRGRTVKEFESYRLPETSFTYLLHALVDRERNTRNVIHATDWRLYLLKLDDLEEELLRLHQFGKLRFERAGSFFELTLPCDDTADYIRSVAG